MGKRIERSREAKGMTQRALADRAEINPKYVVDPEAGR
jgi:transcriptional regulator with XRE-family HTH domain